MPERPSWPPAEKPAATPESEHDLALSALLAAYESEDRLLSRLNELGPNGPHHEVMALLDKLEFARAATESAFARYRKLLTQASGGSSR